MSPNEPAQTSTDPAWAGAARFLEGRVPPGLRVLAPVSFAPVVGTLAEADPATLPDWAIVRLAEAGAVPTPLLRRLLTETTPVYANEGYVVFARRPTFGLADMRNAAPVRALAEVATADRTAIPAPSFREAGSPGEGAAPEAAMLPVVPPRAPGIPRAAEAPEVLNQPVVPPRAADALVIPAGGLASRPAAPPVPVAALLGLGNTIPAPPPPKVEAALPPVIPPRPPVQAPAPVPTPAASGASPVAALGTPTGPPAGRSDGWGSLPARVARLLGEGAGRRIAAFGPGASGLAAASFAASALVSEAPEGSESLFDAALLVADPSLGPDAERAARVLRPGGLLLVVAENAESIGRRLAAALGRPTPAGLSAASLRGALHAAGVRPSRLEGHLLDPWRATGDAPPAGLGTGDPASAILEEAGEEAGPRHAAWLLLLARKP